MRSGLLRTVVLGCIAAGAGIWWLGRAYDVEDSQLLGYLVASAAFVGVVAVLGIAGAALLWFVRRHWRGRKDKPDALARRVEKL